MSILEQLPEQPLTEEQKAKIETMEYLGALRKYAEQEGILLPAQWADAPMSLNLRQYWDNQGGCPRCHSDDIYACGHSPFPDDPIMGCNRCGYYWGPMGGFMTGPGGSWR